MLSRHKVSNYARKKQIKFGLCDRIRKRRNFEFKMTFKNKK